jgi:hypothetical protein
MLNLNAFGNMISTSKPKLTSIERGSIKALYKFIQLEMKEYGHDLKVETTKMD